MYTFVTVHTHNLRMPHVVGLCDESRANSLSYAEMFDALGAKFLADLGLATDKVIAQMGGNNKHPESKEINAIDKSRDGGIGDWKRMAKAASLSTIAATAAAGEKHLHLLKPFWSITTMPIVSETTQIDRLHELYNADPAYATTAATLGLTDVIAKVWNDNEALKAVYRQRLESMATQAGPSASALRGDMEKAYVAYCNLVEQTVNALPNDNLITLFHKLNELRKKYAGLASTTATPAAAADTKDN